MNKKIVFMGTPNFAVPILKNIYQNGFEVSAVYTQQPKKSNRGQKISKSPIHILAETLNLDIRTPSSLKDNDEEYEHLKKINFDLAIIVAYGQLIPKKYLDLNEKTFINLHASILPKWRGAAPIQRSIMNLDKETGISVMKINDKLDSGDVCEIFKLKILDNENAQNLSERLSILASEKILNIIDDISDDKVIFKKQDDKNATYAKKIDKSEGKINWTEDAEKIIGKINGLYPTPGAWFLFNGARYKILKATSHGSIGNPGYVLNDNLEVACGKNSLKIMEIQREGKKVQKINEFIQGTKIKVGSNLNNA
jgi:methionyl-tRNA formyltransferase